MAGCLGDDSGAEDLEAPFVVVVLGHDDSAGLVVPA